MLKAFSLTDVGKRRKVNQDFVYTSEEPVGHLPNLFIVADGMGGHNAGDYASRTSVEIMLRVIDQAPEINPRLILARAIETANEAIRKKALDEYDFEGMGTTVVAATYIENTLHVANVGDSRLYIVNKEGIRQITRDHSLVEEMVRLGGIDRENARNHPDKNIITRAVGASDTVEPDFFSAVVEEGDIVLMCSDGLTNMVEDEVIHKRLSGSGDIVDKTLDLVEAANQNGGRDNISVILIEP